MRGWPSFGDNVRLKSKWVYGVQYPEGPVLLVLGVNRRKSPDTPVLLCDSLGKQTWYARRDIEAIVGT